MSRQSRIVDALLKLKQLEAISEFHKEDDPARKDGGLRWLVMVSMLETKYYSTGEVEAFIAGADAIIRTNVDISSKVA